MRSNNTCKVVLSLELMQWLKETSIKLKVPEKELIEKSLREYKERLEKEKLKESFLRASLDRDIKAMAEENLYNFLEII